MKEIPLTQGKVALVDDDDYERLSEYKWHAAKNGQTYYAQRCIRVSGRNKTLKLHSAILNPGEGYEVDHIDGNGLNNQKCNIRIVTPLQNKWNLHIKKTSKFPGVYWDNERNKWRTDIITNKKKYFLGRFDNEFAAFQTYVVANVVIVGCVP